MTEHSAITDPNLHEPKGVSTATAGRSYRANGSGSGEWERVTGWGQYQDSRTTVGAPALTLSPSTSTQLINDGDTTIRDDPSDLTSELWNTSTNKHMPIAANDLYGVRVGFIAESYGGTSPYITLELDIGGTPGVILAQSFALLKSGAAQTILFDPIVFSGSTYLANGGTLNLTYEGTGTCKIHSVTCLITRLHRSG